jgi:tetratricopeptide (TPR) repeat protein
MVLGWQKNGKYETIPESAWIHPGTTKLIRLEQAHGGPVPAPQLKVRSYMGIANLWLYEVTGALPDELPAGWTVQWKFPDGSTKSQHEFTRIAVGGVSQAVAVKLQRDREELTGGRQVNFTEQIPAASVRNAGDMQRYLRAMAAENLSELPAAMLRGYVAFLLAVEQDQAAGRYAEAWLQRNPDPGDPLWLPAQESRLRMVAQTDARRAVEELRRIPPAGRTKHTAALDLLELDFLVFHLNDKTAVARAQEISGRDPKSETARVALVRAGDYYRLQGRYPEAVAFYQQAQKRVVEGSEGRKLPAQDRAYSITIRDLLDRGDVNLADDKLTEWEARHPVGKLDSDFLILRGRVWLELGRWREALVEIESFEKLQPESPFQIDAEFYRARVLFALGKKDEARKIWTMIVAKYPQHALVDSSRRWAEKP